MGKGIVVINRENAPAIKICKLFKGQAKIFLFYWEGQTMPERTRFGQWVAGVCDAERPLRRATWD